MPLHEAPRAFVQRLQALDPLLRIRWSDVKECYLIERKVTRGQQPDPACYADWEDYQRARDGYVDVLEVPPNHLDDRVLWTLWINDIGRLGGADKVADAMDLNEQQKQRLAREGWLGEFGYKYQEWYQWATQMSPTKTWAGAEM